MNRISRTSLEPRGRTLRSMMKDTDDDLALFIELNRRDKDRSNILLVNNNSGELDPPLGSKIGSSRSAYRKGIDEFLNSEGEKNDYDWLLTPPGTPLYSYRETESNRSPPKARQAVVKSRLANPADTSSRNNSTSRHVTSSSSSISFGVGNRRPSSSGGLSTASRPATPTRRPTLSAPSRPSTPSRPSRTSAPSRYSVPAPSRTSMSASRPSLSAPSKPASRPSTPTRRPFGSCSLPASSAPLGRPRPWKPLDMPGFSLDTPPNLRTSLPERPSSASRGRPGAPSSRSSSVEPGPKIRPRQQSCSPSRGRAPNGVSPGLNGSKMADRVVNARRLAPPRQDGTPSRNNSLTGKLSPSPDSKGIERTLTKNSLDMAMRHMDIRRSIPNNLRPLMISIPASVYSVRSGSTRSTSVSVSGSPLATSSNASSELSFSNNAPCLDGSEVEDDLCSFRGGRSSTAFPRPR